MIHILADAGSLPKALAFFFACVVVLVAIGLQNIERIDSRAVYPTVLPALAPALASGTTLIGKDLVPKYQSDIVAIELQRFISLQNCGIPTIASQPLTHVTIAMNTSKNPHRIFVMLNGENEGYFINWSDQAECLHALGHTAAIALGADADWVNLGVRLYTQHGTIIEDIDDLRASSNIIHVLLEFQLWTWPGIVLNYDTVVDDRMTLTTLSLSPKVFAVSGFFTSNEAQEIRTKGEPHLARSIVDRKGTGGVSETRTSYSGFLPPSQLTRSFQIRGAAVTRLPSPSFCERMQLVRYGAGEFYKKHLDTFDSKSILQTKEQTYTMSDYHRWASWASIKLDEVAHDLPLEFQRGGLYYPNASDARDFPNSLLELFWAHAHETKLFKSRYDESWDEWLRLNLDSDGANILDDLLGRKSHYLPLIIRLWENLLGLPSLRYTFPKTTPPHAISQWYRWIRAMKERISGLGQAAPEDIQPYGPLYPKFNQEFEGRVLHILKEYLSDGTKHILPRETILWLEEYAEHRDALLQLLQTHGEVLPHLVRAWEVKVQFEPVSHYDIPTYTPHYQPQRYVTLFLYLNSVEEGGETVFPLSNVKQSTEANQTGMAECKEGLAVPAIALKASLFYVQTPTQEIDYMSKHGGCPPKVETKWGLINSCGM